MPNSGPFKNLIRGQNPGSGVSDRTRSHAHGVSVAHGAPRRMRMGSASGGAAQPCISRFSLAVSVGVPIGVSLPQITRLAHLGRNVASASVRATYALAPVRSDGGIWGRPRVVWLNSLSSRFSRAVSLGVPLGVSLPQIALIDPP